MSRIVGIIFHYPAPRKPVLRPRLDLRTRALSSRSSNVVSERVSYSPSSAPIALSRTSPTGAPCSNLTKVEQVQHTSFFVSSLQAKQPIQTHNTQFPALHSSSYPEQHIPAYEPQLTFPVLPNATELPFACPEPASCSTAFQQHQSEHMDIDDHPQVIPEPLLKARAQEQSTFTALGSSPHVYTPSYHPQDQPTSTQFSDSPQAQLSNYPPGFSLPHCFFSHSPPVVEYMSTSPSISQQEVCSLPSCEPGIKASLSHVMRPVQNHQATETFAFNIPPDAVTPHLAFSCHPTPPPPPYSDSSESTREVLIDVSPVWQPVSSEYAPLQPLDPKPLAPSASPSRVPEVAPQPSSPADLVRAIGEIPMSGVSPDTADARIDSW